MSTESLSIVGRHSVDTQSVSGRWSVDIATNYQLTISRYWADASWLSIGQISVGYQSNVSDISVNCHQSWFRPICWSTVTQHLVASWSIVSRWSVDIAQTTGRYSAKGFSFSCIWSETNSTVVFLNKTFNISVFFSNFLVLLVTRLKTM